MNGELRHHHSGGSIARCGPTPGTLLRRCGASRDLSGPCLGRRFSHPRKTAPPPHGSDYLLNKETNPQYGQDGSLTLYFADAKPKEAPDGNWLPTPKGIGYSLTFRFYRAKGAVAERSYFPPPLVKL